MVQLCRNLLLESKSTHPPSESRRYAVGYCNPSKAGESQEAVDILAAYVSQDEILEPVGIVLDDPLLGPFSRGELRKLSRAAKRVGTSAIHSS